MQCRRKPELRYGVAFLEDHLNLQFHRSSLTNYLHSQGEKAFAERELKRLHGQNSLLERDINRRESFVGRRRDSVLDKSSKMGDPKKLKGLTCSFDQTLQVTKSDAKFLCILYL